MAMTVEAVTKGLSREEWLKLRNRGIGGSDAAAVAGFHPYVSPVAVWLEKTGQVQPPEIDSEAAEWGNILEDVVAKRFAEKTGLRIQRSHRLYRHREHRFMIGNVDRLITDKDKRRGVLEVKTTNEFNKSDWIDDGDTEEASRIPDHYMIQLQHYLACLGLDYGFFAVLIGGNKFRYKYVERDEYVIKHLIELEGRFWRENVQKNILPDIDGSEASTQVLNYLYPESEPASRIALPETEETAKLIERLYEAQETAKQAEEHLEALKNNMKVLMGKNEEAWFKGDKVFTWKSNQRTTLDTKALKQEMPDIYEQFARTSSSRRFLVK